MLVVAGPQPEDGIQGLAQVLTTALLRQAPEDAVELVRGACADVFALKIAKSGGIHAMLRTAAVGDAAGIALYGGTMLEGSIGTIAAAHGFCALPQLAWGTELFGPLLMRDDIITERPVYRDFDLHLPPGSGLGLVIDEDKLAFYRRDASRVLSGPGSAR